MGPEYYKRYPFFYNALKARYPDLILISNEHTEQQGLPTEITDEHYYDTPEFFCEERSRYDHYDRSLPAVFIGEFQAFQGKYTASLYAALCESMFMLGLERNPDVVKLATYAPMLQNVSYTAWYPDLIAFDNHRVL